MLHSRWFSRSSKKVQGKSTFSGRRRTPRQPAVAAWIEILEPRLVLSTLTVTTEMDVVSDGDGVLSLREAILIANDSTGATTFDGFSSTDVHDVISITAANPISLGGTQLPTILESLWIGRVQIDAHGQSRIFDVAATATLRLENVDLLRGRSGVESGGAIRNAGNLELIDVDISASFSYASGGAISNTGTLTIVGGSIFNNRADDSGGGIFNDGGTVTVTGTVFERNRAAIDGGAIFNAGGTVAISGAEISFDRAGVRGGGVFNAGTMTIADTTVVGNSARSYDYLTTGNILINHAPLGPAQLIEYSVDGTLVQTLPAPSGRDIAVSSADLLPLHFNATVHIHAGTQLKAYDPATGATSSFAVPGLSTASDVTHGGLAVFDRFVFATDQDTGDGLRGVIRRDPDNFSSAIRFGDIDCFDLNIGLDGLLYVLSTGDAVNGGGTRITVFDPLTTASLRTIDLPVEVRAIAVNLAGEIFTAGASGIQHFDANGNLLNTLSTSISGLADIDIRSDEQYLLVVSSGGEFIVTTPALDTEAIFNSGPSDSATFGTFIEAPVRVGTQNEGAGGGIFNATGASLTITSGAFMFNFAQVTGGALQNDGGMLTLDGVLIDRNLTDGDGAGLHYSGSGSVTASNVTFIDNRAEADGGGIWTSASGTFDLVGATITENASLSAAALFAGSNTGALNITDSTISENFGRGIQIEGGTTTIANSTVSNNTASGGGGIRASAGTLQLVNVTIADNWGGGLHNTGAALTLEDVIIDGNTRFGNGGGLYNSGAGSVTGSGVVIANNAVDGDGGGIWTSGSGTFSLLGATIAGNKAWSGAGLFVASGADTLNITDSTISGNDANDSLRTGGGIQTEGGTITLANSTVSGNQAGNGGGIRANGGTLHLLSTTIAANVADESGGGVDQQGATVFAQSTIIATNTAAVSAPDFRGTLQSNGFNLIGNTAGATIAGGSPSDITNVDPLLGPLQNNGGPTKTHALLLGSPATNRGFNAAGAAFDQRGTPFARTLAGATDIGAFELHLSPDLFAVGAGPGGGPAVRVFDAGTGQRLSSFFALNPAFRGGVTVATGDVTGDGFPEIVVGAGPGGGPVVRVFDGLSGAQIGEQILAFPLGFRGGVTVATGDLDGDGDDEIIVGAGPGGAPAVRIFDGATGAQLGEQLLAFPLGFRGGVTVATGDLDGDGDDEIIVGAGSDGAPVVRIFDGATRVQLGEQLLAFPLGFKGGVTVATGDLDGDGDDEIIVGAGPGGGPAVRVFNGATGDQIGETIFAFPSGFRGGVTVGATDVNDDGAAEILAGAGPGGGPALRVFDGSTGLPVGDTRFSFDPQFAGGIFVAGHLGDPEDLVAALRVDYSHAPNDRPASILTEPDVSHMVAKAQTRLQQASEETLAELACVEFGIGDLGVDRLGVAWLPGRILPDDDALGFGWFVDYTPMLDGDSFDDQSHVAAREARASRRIDLLTVALHELGHSPGLDHSHAPYAMVSSALLPGIRALPDREELDALFAIGDGLNLVAI